VDDLSVKTRGQVLVDLMIHALRVTGDVLNAHAAHLLAQLGGEHVCRLVREAASRRNSPAYRLRLLDVIERIGELPTADDWLTLTVLAADKNLQIRHAAARCLVRWHVRATPVP